ncbi:MAG: 8-oxo-dGTP diphosphatase [Cyclobacteriaceae bacterium]|jgi:8-oxo-dGTP diphosphatase
MQDTHDIDLFKNRVRIRVCGWLIEDDQVLLLKHKNIGPLGYLWSPPGGGLEFGEKINECLIREFKEETNLQIEIVRHLCTNEHISQEHHAIELFFLVKKVNGVLKMGLDPELSQENQIITDAKYFRIDEIQSTNIKAFHSILSKCKSTTDIVNLRGFHFFENF